MSTYLRWVLIQCWVFNKINYGMLFKLLSDPWTYTQIHTPTMVRGGGGGWMETLPIVFDMLQYFEMILPLVDLAFDLLNKMKYILQVMALLEACDQQWSPSWPASWILPRIRNQVKTTRNSNFLSFK